MKLINYNRGYNNTFDCSIHGTIKMTSQEWEWIKRMLLVRFRKDIFMTSLFKKDIKRKIKTTKGFLINIRVDATERIVNQFNLINYKRGNYQIEVITI